MKRTSIMLPEDMALRLGQESRRRGVSAAEIVRDALESYMPAPRQGTPLSFFAVGAGGPKDGSERVDEFVTRAVRKKRGS